MRLLLDTQVWLFAIREPGRLAAHAMELLRDPANERLLSMASCWEIAIKFGKGKLSLPEPPLPYITSRLRPTATALLPISLEHACAVAGLPHHHGDPFDRLLVAQAIVEGVPIVTADPHLSQYPVNIIPA
jgi:PIN domain nuclease of toxin-antitoxin system